jgi:hypothetical protein
MNQMGKPVSSKCSPAARCISTGWQSCDRLRRRCSSRRGAWYAASLRCELRRTRHQGRRDLLGAFCLGSHGRSEDAGFEPPSGTLDARGAGRGEPASPVAFVGSAHGHQMPAARVESGDRPHRLRCRVRVCVIPITSDQPSPSFDQLYRYLNSKSLSDS